jgi:2,4-dienoyl-CoA reductase-like NADH-dependent reductase (Old Yellow Enzyme family)
MQLSHSGRQSTTILGGRFPWNPPLAPSAIRVGSMDPKADTIWSRLLYRLLFSTPKEMTLQDIDEVVDAFIHGVKIAFASGFDGVELHASHGCEHLVFIHPSRMLQRWFLDLLAQFISTQVI